MRVLGSAAVAALAISLTARALAHPPPPPPPPSLQQAAAERGANLKACDGDLTVKPIGQTAVRLRPLSGAEIGVKDGRVGKLIYRWGLRIVSDDPRVGGVTGMDLSARDGLVATTAGGNWLTLDLQRGTLADIKGVGVAAMRDAPGRPAGFTEIYGRPLVAFPDQRVVSTFRFVKCGFSAKAEPLFTIVGSPPPSVVAPAAYTYTVVAGNDGAGVGDAMPNLPGSSVESIRLDRRDFQPPPGYRLQALSNPSKIVPFLIALWRSEDGSRTLVQQLYVQAFDDVSGPNPPPSATTVGEFSAPMEAVAGALGPSDQAASLFFVRSDRTPGRVDIYAFDLPRAD